MKEFLIYFLFANVNFALLTTGYFFLIRKEKHFKINRFLLLLIGILPFLLPFFNLKNVEPIIAQTFLNTITISGGEIDPAFASGNPGSSVDIYGIILLGITGISSVFFIKNLVILLLLFIRISKCEKEKFPGYTLVKNFQFSSTASFFHFILCRGEKVDKHELKHEQVHIKKRHTLDVLFATFLQAFCWFNPFVYLYKRMIINNHEFQVDEICIKHFGIQEYSEKLFEYLFIPSGSIYIHNFNITSLTKNRINMMNNNQKRNGLNFIRYILIAPLVVLTLFTGQGTAQVKNEKTAKDSKGEVFTIVEEMPQYNGGEDALFKYLSDEIKYPESAKKDSVEGVVYINFIINKEGKVIEAKVLRGVHPLLDQTALSAIERMDNWIPGKQRGKNVSVLYNLPVKFMIKN